MRFLPEGISLLPLTEGLRSQLAILWHDEVTGIARERCSSPAHGQSCWVYDDGSHVILLTWGTESIQ